MKRIFLGLFMLFDIALIVGSGFFLTTYISRRRSQRASAAPLYVAPAISNARAIQPVPSTMTVSAPGSSLVVPAASSDSSTRNIKFSYRNPRSKKVSIRADFTGWKAEPMQKDANGIWTYQAHLTPGEYAYCYTADDKTFKDPANKRTKQIGRTMVSSILVTPPPALKP